MLHGVRALYLVLLLAYSLASDAQSCSPSAQRAAATRLHAAQFKALAFEAAPMDSGVPPEAAKLLIELKSALAGASDTVLDCASGGDTVAALQSRLNAFLRQAAPGLPITKQPSVISDKDFEKALVPAKGQFGNEVGARASRNSPVRLDCSK